MRDVARLARCPETEAEAGISDKDTQIFYWADVRQLLQKLPNEESVQSMQRLMQDSKDGISRELQRNVFKNYNEFVVISKEISKLEGFLLHLSFLLLTHRRHVFCQTRFGRVEGN